MSTGIEWTDETWNPITGCTKISPGCKNCYAERMARRLAGRYGYPEAPHHFDVALHHDRLEQPLKWRKPRMVFVPSMGDLFHEDVPWEFILWVYRMIKQTPQHTYQILTKRPKRMLALQPHIWGELSNAWFGVSVENQDQMWRVECLREISAATRFLSLEPLLGPIDLRGELLDGDIHWVIVGGESGPGARPMHPDWARSIRDQCQAAGVPFFFKQWGAWAPYIESSFVGEITGYMVRPNGTFGEFWDGKTGAGMSRVGKKRAGCLLDGREVKEWPNLDTT